MLRMGGELNGRVEVHGNFRDAEYPLFRQPRPVQAGLLEPRPERPEGHAGRRDADDRFPRAAPEGGPDPRRRHRPGHDARRTGAGSSSRSTPGSRAGAGLGMAVVRRIVDDYDGRSTSPPSPGRGRRSPLDAAFERRPAGRSKGEAMNTILIVDDEKSLLDLLTVVFKKEGYPVKTRSRHAAGFEILTEEDCRPPRLRHQDAPGRRHGRPPLRPGEAARPSRSS